MRVQWGSHVIRPVQTSSRIMGLLTRLAPDPCIVSDRVGLVLPLDCTCRVRVFWLWVKFLGQKSRFVPVPQIVTGQKLWLIPALVALVGSG
jgi:hypothetical protein